jgi:NitT/TauT family transport system permease protein
VLGALRKSSGPQRAADIAFGAVVGAVVAYGAYEALRFIATSPGAGLGQIPHCFALGLATFGRVVVLLVFATLAFIRLGVPIDIGGILLMSLGAQWYILFNVIAGASAIPSDLREAMEVLGIRGWRAGNG